MTWCFLADVDPSVLIVDLEWVGGLPEQKRTQHVFQIAAVHPCTGMEFSVFVQPRCPDAWLEQAVAHAPQLSREWLQDKAAVDPVSAWREFDRFLHQCDMRAPCDAGNNWVFLAHGAHRADQLVMWQELSRCMVHVGGERVIHWLDTLHFARWAMQLCEKQIKPMAYSLKSLADHYGVLLAREEDQPHDALQDCRALRAVVKKLVNLPRAKGYISGQIQIQGSHSLTLIRGAGSGTSMELARAGICSVQSLLDHVIQSDDGKSSITPASVSDYVRTVAPNVVWSDESSKDLLDRVILML